MASLASSSAGAGFHGGGGSSAAVLEFVCLFTHDLRRKQKRWQDGRLKYHTFNKRVMVYDDRGNFVGDMYWRRDWEFDEGEEIELERGGVIVQVAECVGLQNQDLSELIDKRAKEKEQRAAARPAVPSVPMHTPLSITRTPIAQRDHFQTRHRPLNQLLGTPTGHHGRAVVPTESPYEQRHAADRTPDEESSSRAQKRRRYDDMPSSKMGYAQALFGAPLTLSGAPMSSAPIWRPALSRPQPAIDLTSSQEDRRSHSRAAGITEEEDRRSSRTSPVPETTPAPKRQEQSNRAPVTNPNVLRPPGQKELKTLPRDEENRDYPQLPQHSTSRRGVSSHFSNASEESQRRASLLKNAGLGRAQARDPPPMAVEKRAEEQRQASVQHVFKSRQREPVAIPDNEEDYGEVQDFEDEAFPVPVRQQETNGSEKSAPKPTKGPVQHDRNVGRSTGLFKSNSFAYSTIDTEPEAPPIRAPDPAPLVEEQVKEPRTELRIKSRGRRGLLVMAEMAREAPAKKKTKRRVPTPDIPVDNSLEEQYDIPEQDLLDLPDPAFPHGNALQPDPAKDHLQNANHVDHDDSDPFASLEPAASKGAADATREAAPSDGDDSDPFASPELVVRKRSKLSLRREQARVKQIVADDSMDVDDNEGLLKVRNSSPEVIGRSKRASRDRVKPRDTVYDIPEDTEDEQMVLPRRERSPPEPKQRGTTRQRNRNQPTRKSAEEDAASDPDLEDLPRARTNRTNKRKAERAPSEEKDSYTSAKNRRARPVLVFSDEPSSEEELPKPPPKISKTTRASKTSKAAKTAKPAKPTKKPRLGGKLKSTVKSREVFGFVMSSSPPPPALGGATVATNSSRPTPNNSVNCDQAGGFSAPVPNGNGFADGTNSTSMAAVRKLDPNPAPESRPSSAAPSVQGENPSRARAPAKDTEPPKAVATSTTLGSYGKPNRQRMDANEQARTTTNGGARTNAVIPEERTHNNRGTEAFAMEANRGATVPQSGQPALQKESNGTCAQNTASQSNAPDPVPPQTRARQTITASTGPEKPSTTAQAAGGGAMLPPPTGPPSWPAPPAVPQPQATRQAAVRPPLSTTIVPPTTTSTVRGATTAAPPPPLATTTVNATTPSFSVTAAAGISAAAVVPAAAPAPVTAPANVPPRIQNPASRGRKAALKSDAKGQTPQSILPPPEPLADRSNLVLADRAVARPAGAVSGAGGQEERPKLKMTFPGFVSAREGGPWSREAHDLLGGGRPV